MMIAAIAGGALTWLVHFWRKSIRITDTPSSGPLLMVVACMPTMPLQMIFAQQTPLALATGRERQLGGHDPADVAVDIHRVALGALASLCVPKQIVAAGIYRRAAGCG